MPDVPCDDRFRLLVDSIREYAIVLLDAEGYVTTWNAGATITFGYAAEEIIGRHLSLFYSPDGDRSDQPALQLRIAAETGRFEEEGWRVRKDGSRFWADVLITRLCTPDGTPGGYAKLTRDLSRRRQEEIALRRNEDRLSGIISSAMDAIISVNEEQRIVLFNRAAEIMFGRSAAEVIGRPLAQFIPERYRRAHEGHIQSFGRTGVTSRSMSRPGTLTGLRADGFEFPIEATISQIEADGQKFFTVILRDVTQRVESEQRLQEALEAATAANRAKSEFLAMMSHELRTPLNAIGGYAQLLELGIHGHLNAEQTEQLRRIQRSGDHLLTVINTILNFARLDAGQLEYQLRDVNVRDLLEQVVSLVQPQMRAKDLAFVVDAVDPSLAVRADGDKVVQILLNLLTNAVKFTQPGGRVSVTCDRSEADAIIRISDSGIGIAADKLEAVFEPFFQLERKLTRTVDGTGLGLAISRELARAMAGDVMVDSTPLVGSTFSLRLPLAPATAPLS